MVLDAFIIERLHLRVKRQAEVVCNLSISESAVLCGVLNEQFRDCTTPLTNRLVGHTISTPTFHHASVGERMVIGNLRIGSGDSIYRHNVAGSVECCAEEDGKLYAVVGCMEFVDQVYVYCIPI